MACSRCGQKKSQGAPSGIRPGTNYHPAAASKGKNSSDKSDVKGAISGLKYVPSGK